MKVQPLYQTNFATKSKSGTGVFFLHLIAVLWVITLLLLAVFTLSFVASALGVYGVRSINTHLFSETSPSTGLVLSLTAIVGAFAFLVILRQLKLICQTLVNGDPFVPENAGRIRIIWIAVATAEVLRLVAAIGISMVHNKLQDGETVMTVDLRIHVWFLVLALIVLAGVFREGTRLRQDQKLTI